MFILENAPNVARFCLLSNLMLDCVENIILVDLECFALERGDSVNSLGLL